MAADDRGLYAGEGCADRIACPTLVIDCEYEHAFAGKTCQLYDALRCEKTFMYFSGEDGAGEHCQVAARLLSQQRIFDWLDGVLAVRS